MSDTPIGLDIAGPLRRDGEARGRGPANAVEVDAAAEADVVQPIDVAYRRLYPSLVRLAILLVDTPERAEEIVQDAFARAYPKWHRIVHHDAYMRSTVINLCRKAHRRRSIARRAPQYPVADSPAAGDVADHVYDAVRALPSPMREIVVMRYYLQASDAEIADTLRLPAGTVKSTLHRARTILRRELT